jgi:hypothetical protein
MSNQRKFFTEGYCMVLDDDVVRAHVLEDVKAKMIDGNVIKNILTYDENKIKNIFSNVLPAIQQTIVETVIQHINSGEFYEKPKVDIISEIFGQDIISIARQM